MKVNPRIMAIMAIMAVAAMHLALCSVLALIMSSR
jgi:hypothetical protein